MERKRFIQTIGLFLFLIGVIIILTSGANILGSVINNPLRISFKIPIGIAFVIAGMVLFREFG